VRELKRLRPNTGPDGDATAPARSQLVFYEDTFVFDTISGTFYRLNSAAAFALRAITDGTTARELPEKIQCHYGIDHRSAVRDAELFLNDLAALGLLAEREQ
jgi:hypothetical protein